MPAVTAPDVQPEPSALPEQQNAVEDIPQTEKETVQPPKGAPQKQPKSKEISFNFDDADVFSVIQTIFGDVLKVNYVIDPQVKGRVTYRSVAPIPRENVLPLMEVILRMNGIAVVEDAGLYRIIPIADIPREPARMDIGRDPEEGAGDRQGGDTGGADPLCHLHRRGEGPDAVRLGKRPDYRCAQEQPHLIIDTASNVKRLGHHRGL
jgi:hypothetical protein